MPKVNADKAPNGKIRVTFDFDPTIVARIKTVPGHKFIPDDKGGPAWDFPLELSTGRILRERFGDQLVMRAELRTWADAAVKRETELSSLAVADAAPLTVLPAVLPDLWRAVHVGPLGKGKLREELEAIIQENPDGSYQTADVGYLAAADNPLNGNQPGLGKTIETIASIFEAEMDEGPHLVLAPITSLETVWFDELARWQPHPVWMVTGDPSFRREAIRDFMETDGPGWLICNHHMAQMNRKVAKDGSDKTVYTPKFPELYDLEWNSIILDEVHKAGFRDTKSLLYRGINALTSLKRFALSGTPVGGKPINLWHILHWLEPEIFSNKWNWAEQWLFIGDNGYGKDIGGIRPDREEEFYKYHSQFFLRRLKSEVLPWLPEKDPIDVWVNMEGRQAKQYEQMALEAEIRIEDESLSAFGILAEYVRLKQFAISYNTLETRTVKGERKVFPKPTTESCKLDALEQLLDERGVFPDSKKEQVDVKEQVVVFSQFSTVVDMIYSWLVEKGVVATKLTGDTPQSERTETNRAFQRGECAVLVMTTTAGGTAITLDNADTVIFMDETWDPGDQEQASDRIHRASRIHQVTVYTIRTRKTIEDYIMRVLMGKENVNKIILDLRRQGLRATGNEEVEDGEDADE